MPDSDNEKSAAIDKVVGAFRARREQAKDDPDATASSAPETPEGETPVEGPTPVVKLDAEPAAPQPKGSDSESPTRAFKIPAGTAAAAEDSAADDNAAEDNTAEDGVPADDSAGATTPGGLVEETVVGEPAAAVAPESDGSADAPAAPPKDDVVEESVDLGTVPDTEDEGPDAEDEGEEPVDTAESVSSTADVTPTEKIAVPAAAGAAAAAAGAATTKISTQKAPAPATDSSTAPNAPNAQQAAPQVIAPQKPQTDKKRGKVLAAVVAVLVVVVAIVIGAVYLFGNDSPESEVADAATSYQDAMNAGDLSALRDVTCGEENVYYSNVSDEDFGKAYDTQKTRNELMRFDEVNSVAIDGDSARVGVDMYNSGDSSKKVPAQITLHKVDGDWKVCKSLD